MNDDTNKIKGTAMISLRSYCQEIDLDECFQSHLKSELPEVSRLLASQWYPAESYLNMCKKLAGEVGNSPKVFVINLSAHSAERDLNGIYKALLRVTGSKLVLSKLPHLAKWYTSYLESNVVLNEPSKYHIEFISPAQFFDLTVWNFEGATRSMLKVFGAKPVAFEQLKKEVYKESGEQFIRGLCELTYVK